MHYEDALVYIYFYLKQVQQYICINNMDSTSQCVLSTVL